METKIHYMEQLSDEWFIKKLDIISASKAPMFLVNGKGEGGCSVALIKYAKDCARKLLVKKHDFDGFCSKSASRGIYEEAEARRQFSLRNMVNVKEVGFIEAVGLRIGCSPDGVPETEIEEGLEIKCFDSSNHLDVVLSNSVPKDVNSQCQFSLMVTGWAQWRAVFWDGRVCKDLQYKEFVVSRDEELITLFYKKALILSRVIDEEVARFFGDGNE